MIPKLPGWSWKTFDSGVVQSSAEGELLYRERVRPLRDIRAIVRSVQQEFPTRRALHVRSIDPLITHEGEYGAIAVLRDAQTERIIAAVFGDDFYALVVGFAAAPERGMVERVRAIALADAHMLGVRRRRYVYTPPQGWVGCGVGPFHALWRPERYPTERARLFVYPAVPMTSVTSASELLQQVLGDIPTQDRVEEPFTTSKLTGSSTRIVAGDVAHDLVVLQDARYLYSAHLHSSGDVHRGVLRELAQTIEPLPAQRTTTRPSLAWAVD